MDWYDTVSAVDFPVDTMRNVEVAGREVLLVNAGGQFFAVNHFCTHDDIDLALGCIKGETIKCSLHGAIFDLNNGDVLADPAEEPLQTWQTKVVDDTIQILI